VCRGHILNTLSDRLHDLFTTMTSPKEIWKALETKYKTEKQGTDKFIIQKYFDFKMLDNVSVLDQVHELQVLVHKLNDLSIKIPELFQSLRNSHLHGTIIGRSFCIWQKNLP
jgi:hypothetical protein